MAADKVALCASWDDFPTSRIQIGAQTSHPAAPDDVYGEARGLRSGQQEQCMHPEPLTSPSAHHDSNQSGRDDPSRSMMGAELKSNSAARQGH